MSRLLTAILLAETSLFRYHIKGNLPTFTSDFLSGLVSFFLPFAQAILVFSSLSLCPHPIPHRPCPGDRGHRSSSATARGGFARRHHRQPSRGGRTKAGLENKLRVALDLRAPDLTMRAYLGGRGGVSKSSKQMRSRGFCGSAGRGGPLGRIKVVAGGAFSNLAYPSSARIPIAD